MPSRALRPTLLLAALCACSPARTAATPAPEPTGHAIAAATRADAVTVPPRDVVVAWRLSPIYAKYVGVSELPVISSRQVSDFAVLEAAFLIRQMIGPRREILRAMVDNRVRFVVMATAEMTTDVPEHSDLTPKAYWNRRARGLGATSERPAVSCGEENLDRKSVV